MFLHVFLLGSSLRCKLLSIKYVEARESNPLEAIQTLLSDAVHEGKLCFVVIEIGLFRSICHRLSREFDLEVDGSSVPKSVPVKKFPRLRKNEVEHARTASSQAFR